MIRYSINHNQIISFQLIYSHLSILKKNVFVFLLNNFKGGYTVAKVSTQTVQVPNNERSCRNCVSSIPECDN